MTNAGGTIARTREAGGGMPTQVHARRAGRDRDVGAIVDQHARGGSGACLPDPPDERGSDRDPADRARAPG